MHFRDARMVKHIQINKYNNTLQKQNQDNKTHEHLNSRKSLCYNSTSFHDENPEETYFNIIRPKYDKLTGNILLKTEIISIKSGTRKRCPFSLLLLKIVLEFLTTALRQVIQGTQKGKEETKLFLFADDVTPCLKNHKESN
jgi:hypothetical protein